MRKPRGILVLITACLAVAGVTHVIRGQLLHAVSADFKEFTITKTETSGGPNSATTQRVVFAAHRLDGSTASGEVAPDEGSVPARQRFVWLVPERVRVTVNDSLRARTTLYFKDVPAPHPPAPDPHCGFSQLAAAARPSLKGEADVLGFRTVVIQTEEQTDSGESFLHTDWRAPDLDCTVLRTTEDRRDKTGNITGHFEMQTMKVAMGPPAPKLFQVPQDYVENSPSQMYDALIAKFGNAGSVCQNMRRTMERSDEQYFANHKAAGIE